MAPVLPTFSAAAQQPGPATATPPQPGVEDEGESAEDVDLNTPGVAGVDQEPEAESVDVSGPGANRSDDVIVIQGRYIPEPVRASSEVVNVLSSEEIARSGEGDIASALQRVTGLSLVGGRFVYVRGLGERYSLALLNGSPLPSPEPQRRVVPLDIFPTSVIASSVVQKSYSVAYPGEFGGGVINLTTLSIPEETFLSIGGSIGANSLTSMERGYTYFGSDLDFLGFDDGSRDIPNVLKKAFAAGQPIVAGNSAFPDEAATDSIAIALNNASTSLVQGNDHLPFNGALDLTFGTAIDVGSDRLGIVANVGWDNSWFNRGGKQQFTGFLGTNEAGEDILDPVSDGRDDTFLTTDNRIVANALLGVGYEFGEHKIRWTNLYIRDSLKQAGFQVGTDAAASIQGTPTLRQKTAWFERSLIDTNLVAEFDFDQFQLDVRGTYANTQRESPYEREFNYRFIDTAVVNGVPIEVNDYVNALNGQGQFASVAFSELEEEVYAGSLDLGYDLNTDMPIRLSAGGGYTKTQRDSFVRELQYKVNGALPFSLSQSRPDFLISDFVLLNRLYDDQGNPVTVTISEGGRSALGESSRYNADLEVWAGYGQVEVEPMDFLKATVGVRYESAQQSVNAFDVAGTVLAAPRIDNDYFLPAGTLTWNFAEDMQLRLAGSKTIARPQFRELAPQQYSDTESDRTLIGNPFLKDSELINAEARYEWYPNRKDRFSAAGFYKHIDSPIEAYSFIGGGGSFFGSFLNAPSAQLYGAEVEVQKFFPLYDWGLEEGLLSSRNIVLIANYTYTQSKVNVDADDMTIDAGGISQLTSNFIADGDPLIGQSDHLLNLQFGLEDEDTLSQQTILLTYASERVASRFSLSSVANPGERVNIPFIEEPGWQLDVVLRQGFEVAGVEFEAKFEARNLLDTEFREVQQLNGTEVQRLVYGRGQNYSLGLGVTF